MITALALILATSQLGPIQYSGVPQISGGDLVSHRVVFAIADDQAKVTTESRIYVNKLATVTISVPRFARGERAVKDDELMPVATVDRVQIPLRVPMLDRVQSEGGSIDARGNVLLSAGNHTLTIEYKTTAARTGLGQKQRTFAYALGGGAEIPRVEFVYHYDQRTVFNLPDMEPDWGWQTGKTGTYLKKNNYKPNGDIVFFTYYSAKVEDEK